MFSIDANGVLEVTASVKGEEGSSKSVVIQKDKGLLTAKEIKAKTQRIAKWEKKCRAKKLN